MKHKAIMLVLLCLLLGPAVARPNTEPLYHRSNTNPLEVTEEIIPTTNALPPIASDSDGQQTSSSLNSAPTTVSTTTSATSAVTQDHTSRYTKLVEETKSSESLIKSFLLKNLSNLRKQYFGNYGVLPSLVDEPNTIRSVSVAPLLQTSPLWNSPGVESQYHYMNARRKPVIHKIITKWTDKTQDAFNLDYTGQSGFVTPVEVFSNFGTSTGVYAFPTTTPEPVILVAKPVYPDVTDNQLEVSFLDNGYQPEPEQNIYAEEDTYQGQQEPIHEIYTEPPKLVVKKKRKKNKNKLKQPQIQQSTTVDPDRPDALFWNDFEQDEHPGWNQQGGLYETDNPKDPYDDEESLKNEGIKESELECSDGIRISVDGKQVCNKKVEEPPPEEATKVSAVPVPPVVPAAANDPAPGPAVLAAPESQSSQFMPFIPPLLPPPQFPPPPQPPQSFLDTPLGDLVSNIMEPTRVGSLGAAEPEGGGHTKHKHKPLQNVVDDGDGYGSLFPDTSHALFGMIAAISAMTPMNIILISVAALPVVAIVIASVAVGMYMYSKLLPPIKNYSTIVVRKPPPIPASIVQGWQPSTSASSSSSGWFDFSNMWSSLGFGGEDRRRVGRPRPTRIPVKRLSPYRAHRPKSGR